MAEQERWQWQGRQEHGWFGHGTKPQGARLSSGGRAGGGGYGSAPADLDQRIRTLGTVAVAGLPASKRYHPAARHDGPAMGWLIGAIAPVDRTGGDDKTSADMREATNELAAGMLAVGLDRWPRFLKEAHDRA